MRGWRRRFGVWKKQGKMSVNAERDLRHDICGDVGFDSLRDMRRKEKAFMARY